MKLIRDEGWRRAWEHGDVQLIHEDHGEEQKLFVIFGRSLNARIYDGRVDFLAGSPADLRRALLSLTGEDDAEPLADIASGTAA